MATPEATFFVFLFYLSPFHLFTTNVTRAISLETIKGEVGATSRGIEKTKKQHTLLAKTSTHTHHPSKETWDPLILLKACNPYYEHSGARQHEQQQNPLDVGPFMPEPVYTLVSALHTIRPRHANINLLVALFRPPGSLNTDRKDLAS
jgi:hypothetical protein